jgi:hypothetical protein
LRSGPAQDRAGPHEIAEQPTSAHRDGDKLAQPPFGFQPDLSGVDFRIAVLGLPRVDAHGLGLVANILGLVGGFRYCQRTTCCIVADKRRAAAHSGPRVGRLFCRNRAAAP